MEKQDIVIVVACLALLLLWFVNQGSMRPPNQVKEENHRSESSIEQRQSDFLAETPPGHKPYTPPSAPKKLSSDQLATDALIAKYVDLAPASPVTLAIEGNSDFTIDPEIGGITEIVIHQFKDKDGIHMMRLGLRDFPMFSIQNSQDSWKFSHAITESIGPKHLTISRAILGSTLVLEQSWKVNQDAHYGIDYTMTLRNLGDKNITLEDIQVNCGVMQQLDDTKSFMGAGGIDQRVDILLSGSDSPKTINIDKILAYDEQDREKNRELRIDWLAVQNKYFVSLVSGEMPFSGCDLVAINRDKTLPSKDRSSTYISGDVYLPRAKLDAHQSRTWRFSCYTGPKQYDLLKELGQNKESILQFDLFLLFHFNWMKGISLGILWSLNKLEAVFHNYGVAIIIITLLIRVVFWPITHQTTMLSKRMQKIQPLAQEIREKYKDEPLKMQQKTMELYREHKINPVAGCLPMLLQIPVFFALFNVLRSAVELRQAQFLWATDLSQQDSVFTFPLIGIPLNPLAILMGITMVWQQKIVPTSADPMQQKVMTFMTIFFVFILYSMPSGLTLYWSVNQIISIIQHKITRMVDINSK